MNIKQAESLSGISKRNIRFYEQEDLIHPARNQENDYREYSEEDINTLKLIRALRMVDMPLEQIREVIGGRTELKEAANAQKEKLKQQIEQLEAAISFCDEFGSHNDINSINIDEVLSRMDAPENKKELFWKWINDYQKVAAAEHEIVFTFIPDGPVTNPSEFTLALLEYAEKNELNIYITKEGMCPKFTIDDIEYTAERYYTSFGHIPVAAIRCQAVHPEDFEPNIPENKKKLFKFLHYGWISIPLIIIFLLMILVSSFRGWLDSWDDWIVLISIPIMIGVELYLMHVFTHNENGKKNSKKK